MLGYEMNQADDWTEYAVDLSGIYFDMGSELAPGYPLTLSLGSESGVTIEIKDIQVRDKTMRNRCSPTTLITSSLKTARPETI